MFDSPPSNLPLESAPVAPPTEQPAPAPSPATPPFAAPPRTDGPQSTVPLKKEPEDIFADIDRGGGGAAQPKMETMPLPPRSSPLKAILIGLVIVIVLGGIGYVVWTLFIQPTSLPAPVKVTTTKAPGTTTTKPTTPIVETPPPAAIPQTPPTTPATSSPPGTFVPPPVVPTSSIPTPTTPVKVAPIEAIDSDADGLSDVEEVLFGTDPMIADSDGDGFPDGAEVAGGYDPAVAKGKLEASAHFRMSTITDNWSVLLPQPWTIVSDGNAPGDYLVQTGTPTTFSFHVGVKPALQTFTDWLAMNDPTVTPTDLHEMKTRAGYAAWQSSDRLTTYIIADTTVFVVRYRVGTSPTYDDRAVYGVLVQTLVRHVTSL